MQTLGSILQNKFIGTDDLRKDLTTILDKMPETGDIVVTQHGKPQAVLMDLNNYLELQETLEDLQTPGFINSVYEGIKEIDEGKGITHKQLLQELDL